MSRLPYPRVIVGTDGSVTATEAVRRAARYAGAIGVPLVVACVFERTHPADLGPPSERAAMPGDEWLSVYYRAALEVVSEAAGVATAAVPGLAVDTATPEGNPAEQLLELAEAEPGCLLAVGSQGMTRSKRFLLGAVPNKVSHHAVGDVLIVRTGEGRPDRLPSRILAGHDGSARSARALERALALAGEVGASVTVITVTDDEARGRAALADAERLAADAGVAVEPLLRSGQPAEAILDAAPEADLVVVGNRGMTTASRFVMGSVPNRMSHHIDRDLLIVQTND